MQFAAISPGFGRGHHWKSRDVNRLTVFSGRGRKERRARFPRFEHAEEVGVVSRRAS